MLTCRVHVSSVAAIPLSRSRMKFKALTACSAAAMLAAHSAAISIEPETPHARLNEIVKQLDSDTLSQREAAFTSLRTDGAITLDLIEGCLNDPTKDISLEQCTRLERCLLYTSPSPRD